MTTSEFQGSYESRRLRSIVERGVLTAESFEAAWTEARSRDVELEWVLRYDYHVPRRSILNALAEFHQCSWVEYDERLPIPSELLEGLDADRLCVSRWFPVIKDAGTVVIAASDPGDPRVRDEVAGFFPEGDCELRVALAEDIAAFIQDFCSGKPQHLMGNERTGLAFWRNTMARWRTRLACYRTDFAMARTHFSLLRGGLGLITIGRTLLRLHRMYSLAFLYWLMIVAGFGLVILGLLSYKRIRRSIMSPPKHQTLVEVTAATLYFFENYQYAENKPVDTAPKGTMLARLAEILPNCCVFIDSSLDNKVRSYLAHERNSLAAQRTVTACYRTIYARARTGLSFIRTGVSFASIGVGLISYFGLSVMTFLDMFLITAGLLLIIDGAIWYWPVRREQCEAGKCAVIF